MPALPVRAEVCFPTNTCLSELGQEAALFPWPPPPADFHSEDDQPGTCTTPHDLRACSFFPLSSSSWHNTILIGSITSGVAIYAQDTHQSCVNNKPLGNTMSRSRNMTSRQMLLPHTSRPTSAKHPGLRTRCADGATGAEERFVKGQSWAAQQRKWLFQSVSPNMWGTWGRSVPPLALPRTSRMLRGSIAQVAQKNVYGRVAELGWC